MTPEQKAAYVNSQTAAMLAEMESMKAANRERESHGYADAYDEQAFLALIDNYCLNTNSVMMFFNEE